MSQYPPQDSPLPGYPQQPGYPQSGAVPQYPPTAGYPGYQQPGYQQPGYQQPGYQQPGYQQPGYPGYPQQPGYPSPYVAVPNPQMLGPQPPSNTGWAVVAILFFWPLAIAAFIASNKIGPAWMMGDVATAQKASADTKKYGIIALCLGLGLVVVWVIIAVTAVSAIPRYGY